MDNIASLTEKINTKTKDSPIFFITNDPERALGLEKLLSNFHIVCIDDNEIVDYLRQENIKIFSLEKETSKLNIIFRNSYRLLKHDLTQEYIQKNSQGKSGYFMFFKINPVLEKFTKKLGFGLINTSSELNQKFELKLSQYEAIKNLDIRLPETKIVQLSQANYSELVSQLGQNFILQFNRGHTGGGTLIIDNERKLLDLIERFPKRKARFARYISGDAYTLNACVTKHGICWGGLSYQITGVEECTSKKAATVGNDWEQTKHLPEKTKQEIGKFTKIIGQEMAKFGFLGMFGLDFVVQKTDNKPYLIEINARQPASVPMFSKLQLQIDQIPLNLLAMAEFLNIDYEINCEEYSQEASSTFQAAQLFIRNKFDENAKVIGGIKPGVYRLVGDNTAYDWKQGHPKQKKHALFIDEGKDKPLIFKNKAYAIDGIKTGGLLFLCSKEGKIISPNNEVARIQACETLLEEGGNLKPLIREIITGLNKYIILKKIPNGKKAT